MTKRRALELLSELYDGFANAEFQQQLHELVKINISERGQDLRCIEGRQALALAVQQHILPRYGFSGDESGVLAMKMAVRKHMGDPRVARKSMDIRDKLLIPEVRKEVPATPVPAQAPPAPVEAPAVAQAPARPAKTACEAAIKQDQEMEVMVQHARGHGELTVRVPVECSMLQMKEAVVEALGRGSVADMQLVMWGGGMFVNHRDCDMVMTERVFSTGLDLRDDRLVVN